LYLKITRDFRFEAFEEILFVCFLIRFSDLLSLINISMTQYCNHTFLISPPSYTIKKSFKIKLGIKSKVRICALDCDINVFYLSKTTMCDSIFFRISRNAKQPHDRINYYIIFNIDKNISHWSTYSHCSTYFNFQVTSWILLMLLDY
jgi:hypothetical protein